jgi:hypothetical protein
MRFGGKFPKRPQRKVATAGHPWGVGPKLESRSKQDVEGYTVDPRKPLFAPSHPQDEGGKNRHKSGHISGPSGHIDRTLMPSDSSRNSASETSVEPDLGTLRFEIRGRGTFRHLTGSP